MTVKRLISFFSILLILQGALAQKKELATAHDQIKSGKNLDKAEALMTKLLADSANRHNEKIWLMLFAAQKAQYDQGNEKLYLKQKYDTAQLFQLTHRMFETLTSFDSIDATPDKRGRVKLNYRRRHAEQLHEYRPNLYNGGLYYIRKHNYAEGYRFMDMYIHNACQQLFREYQYNEKDTMIPRAAYWAVYCGWKMGDPKSTLHHAYIALKDTAHTALMLQYLAETYLLEKDSARYIETLREGFMRFPRFSYFFPRLLEYYSESEQLDSALRLVDRAILSDTTNAGYRQAKSSVLLNMGRYDECIVICDTLLAHNDTLEGALLNKGLAIFNQAVELDKVTRSHNRKTRGKILALYEHGRGYLEKFRQQSPEAIERWGMPLYIIYLNLNMGEKFDEVDKLLRKKRSS